MQGAGHEAISGWNSERRGFDYNLDHLGIGTLDLPEWKIQDRTDVRDAGRRRARRLIRAVYLALVIPRRVYSPLKTSARDW